MPNELFFHDQLPSKEKLFHIVCLSTLFVVHKLNDEVDTEVPTIGIDQERIIVIINHFWTAPSEGYETSSKILMF